MAPAEHEQDLSEGLAERVRAAFQEREILEIVGAGTRRFLGRPPRGAELHVAGHRGILNYEPTELVVAARAGTPLETIETALAGERQMLAFEPPRFAAGTTLGGALATGLSGPRRPFTGAARDFTLGVKVLNGKGERLAFGGEVMKNVAGYDVSRLMVGAFGTLGVLLEVALKVLPQPAAELTLAFECDAGAAIERMNAWAGRPLPLSGACHLERTLLVRLSGTERGVAGAAAALGGELADEGVWPALRDLSHPFFAQPLPLWRLSLPSTAPPVALEGASLIDWCGAQRWLASPAPASHVREAARTAGGHATLFRGGDREGEVFTPLEPSLLALHQRLKDAFDPHRILNAGRLYAEL